MDSNCVAIWAVVGSIHFKAVVFSPGPGDPPLWTFCMSLFSDTLMLCLNLLCL